MIESNYRDLFSQTVVLYAPSTLDAYGKRTFSASAQSFSAHFISEVKQMTTPDGRTVVSAGRVYLYGTSDATTDYQMVINGSASPVILSVDNLYDDAGRHHTVITYGAS